MNNERMKEPTEGEIVRQISEISMQIGVFEKSIDAIVNAIVLGDLDQMTPAEARDALSNKLDFLSDLFADLPGYPGDPDAVNDIKKEIWDVKKILNANRIDNKLTPDDLDEMLDRLSYLNGELYAEQYGQDPGPVSIQGAREKKKELSDAEGVENLTEMVRDAAKTLEIARYGNLDKLPDKEKAEALDSIYAGLMAELYGGDIDPAKLEAAETELEQLKAEKANDNGLPFA